MAIKTILDRDHRRLVDLVDGYSTPQTEFLEEMLQQAKVVPLEQLPKGTVAMNSKVKYLDLDSGAESSLILVYPEKSDISKEQVSILAPAGAALLGAHEGEDLSWPSGSGGNRRIRVLKVSLPES